MRFKSLLVKILSPLFVALWRHNFSLLQQTEDTLFRDGFAFLHPSVKLHRPIHVGTKRNVYIYENVNIAPFVQIWANAKVTIGRNTLIASHCVITTSTHDYKVAPIRTKRIDLPITIGDDVWIGSGAMIFPGVNIGDGAVIGAGSVVMKDVEANSVYVGVPARKIKDRF